MIDLPFRSSTLLGETRIGRTVTLHRLMVLVAFAAIAAVAAPVGRRIPDIFSVTFQALAMHPAAACRGILTAGRLRLAHVAIFFDGDHHAASAMGASHFTRKKC